ncbi:related to Membrane protein TMS1 [Saccharomycodes ludwigii]|uniref:Related to Membrane protein TMS1 n=1 Tax=Saccharomycodes ludwigii TaxID=36035 RepID=A0A376B0U0_9ASCO|nr:hypothetical protein SCDLUD_001685 [Saccharomycodes ludwigii]KAH3901901.1 hypothetical protein SCDLUD_001685 [Saccharomycodes ludwigii]SSD58287.1 related to Membrane protein TMS1 [Saccharomycodes ludwigii]
MGALISLPITATTTFVSSFLGSTISNLFHSIFASNILGARLIYALLLILNSVVSWVSMSTNHSILYPSKTCQGLECGVFSVYRLNFSLGLLHLILFLVLLIPGNGNSGGSGGASFYKMKLQNSLWSLKIIIWGFTLFSSFKWMNNDFFISFAKYISIPSGTLFNLIGLVLLVDFAYEFAEVCLSNIEKDDETSSFWKKLLVCGTASMYVSTLIMTVAIFVVFNGEDCNMNKTASIINVILNILVSVISVMPKVQEYNSKCGLAQSAIVSLYCTYLTLSAMVSEPDDKRCNPLIRSAGTRRASVILGAIFTFVAIAYTTTRVAATSMFTAGNSHNSGIYLGGDDNDLLYSANERNELRVQALRDAVAEGSLPESVLHDMEVGNTEEQNNSVGENGSSYDYCLFHVIFFLATQWISILLTVNVQQNDNGDFIPVGRTYFYSWVKIISAWVCYGLYIWSMIAPMLMPDRFDYDSD